MQSSTSRQIKALRCMCLTNKEFLAVIRGFPPARQQYGVPLERLGKGIALQVESKPASVPE
jgi:hypothetical protein